VPVITSGAHPAAMWPGVHKFFGMEYNKHPVYYVKIFDVMESKKQYEEDVVTTGFGLGELKPQSQSVVYDEHTQEGTRRYNHDTWGLGYIVTKEERDDNLYLSRSFKRAKALARSMRTTQEINGANILNRAFNATYADGWDAKELCATDHQTQGGISSNELSTPADLSESSIEDLCINISLMDDSRGLKAAIRPKCLIIPSNLRFDAHRILKSDLQAGSSSDSTNTNATNALKDMNTFPDGICVNPYLTDTDAWFIKTDVDAGLQVFERRRMAFTQDNDFDTDNAKAKATQRYSFGWSDWRGCFGSPGAA